MVYVAASDPYIKEYRKTLRHVEHVVGKYRTMPEVLNWFSTVVYPDVPYYHEVNDDHICRTKGWDEAFIQTLEDKGNGWGIICGKDGVDGETEDDWRRWEHPSAVMISGNIIRALGYYLYPEFKNICCDDFTRDLGKSINRLFYLHNVFIEHVHCTPGEGVKSSDDNYKTIYDPASISFGYRVYEKWRRDVLPKSREQLLSLIQVEEKHGV